MHATFNQRTQSSPPKPPRTAALTAGIALLLMATLAFFTEFYVRTRVVDSQNFTVTLNHLRTSGSLFRAGNAANLIVAALDVLVAAALYEVFRHAGRGLALFAAANRAVYAAIFAIATLGQVLALHIATGAASPTGDQLVLTFLDLHTFGWQIGLTFFAIHLAVLGGLIVRSGAAPRWIGALLILAGGAYLTDAFANLLLPNYVEYASVLKACVALPALASELSLCTWLLMHGMRDRRASIAARLSA